MNTWVFVANLPASLSRIVRKVCGKFGHAVNMEDWGYDVFNDRCEVWCKRCNQKGTAPSSMLRQFDAASVIYDLTGKCVTNEKASVTWGDK